MTALEWKVLGIVLLAVGILLLVFSQLWLAHNRKKILEEL